MLIFFSAGGVNALAGVLFVFKIGVDLDNVDCVNGLLVDCGATTHIVHDISKFTRFDEQFNPEYHYIEPADGSRSNNVALKRGDANVELCDGHGNGHGNGHVLHQIVPNL